jgi:16S rRNA (cytosine967-C5)-methyltransferase
VKRRSSAHTSARAHGAAAPSSRALAYADAAGLATRRTACEILLRVDRDRAFADVLLGRRLSAFAPADRRLVTQLVLGTIAWRGRLDYELARISARKLDTLTPEVLTILRLGLYQLRILTRVPRHAAVDTAVSLAHETPAVTGAARFVNAVLRSAIRAPVPPPGRDADEIEYLATMSSHPRWIVEKFLQWFGGREAEALMAANNEAAPNVIRLNLARGTAAELIASLERDQMQIAAYGRFPETVILKGAPIFASTSFRDGLFQPQAEASQMVARMLAPKAGGTVVECAAAPGGKSTHLAEIVGGKGMVVALDLSLTGLKNGRTVAARLGHRNICFARADCAFALPIRPVCADYVLLDAPCTGLGTLREHPELRWRLQPSDFARMAATQTRMLERAAAIVKPGGALVYAVCSLAPEEGEHVVREFLLRHSEFDLDRKPPGEAALVGVIDSDGFMRTRPDRGALDGFFAARITRRQL